MLVTYYVTYSNNKMSKSVSFIIFKWPNIQICFIYQLERKISNLAVGMIANRFVLKTMTCVTLETPDSVLLSKLEQSFSLSCWGQGQFFLKPQVSKYITISVTSNNSNKQNFRTFANKL